MKKDSKLETIQALSQVLRHFTRLRWEQQLPRWELKHSECELLGMLYISLNDGTKAVTASELSSLLNITPAGVTHLINPLEKNGYVERLQNPDDRRVVLIGLTGKGKDFAELLIAEANEKLAGLVDHLGEEDSKTLIRLVSSTLEYFSANPIGQKS